ncbi:MAG: DUF2304 family protein [Patescibacteria group bacterium]
MALIQIILIAFSLFALSRVVLRFRGGQIRGMEFIFWSTLFSIAIIGIALPGELSRLAGLLGIGRGVDLITYASIAILFYLVFRLYVFLEDIRHEITEVVRMIALQKKK